ncbi:MAG: DNA mismatch repair endonuclease MutL [Clostridia bacterium]|nr:DNA mismatch repair endonuclease MutL [Clostridia bacterium]
MGKINVLDFEIANLIAAGEVVERPSSVLKELIENSIDSGATSIVAEIKRGGVALIRVSDNGCGMERDDLPVAIKRHATSKIKNREDLDGITTLGFRGEALAAISSVSAVTIITKTADAENGSMLVSEGGRILDISEVGCAAGTTVVVENLFFNVPARRKFLKKDSTEAMNCAALVEKVALSRPDISIQLTVDGEERFKTPGDNNLLNTIYAVFGKDFASKLIEADGTANGVHVHGYIGRSDNVRKNRNYQNFFINGRYVKSLTAMAAIEKAYTSYIAHEAFPTCVLFLDMNPTMVDVNVHPAKLEVKFASEQPVFEAIYYTVKRAIEDHEYRPEMVLQSKSKSERNWEAAFVPIGEDTKGKQLTFAAIEQSSVGIGNIPPAITKPKTNERDADYSRPIKVASSAADSFSRRESSGYQMTPKSSVDLLKQYSNSVAKNDYSPKTPEKTEQKEKTPLVTESINYKFIGEAFNCYLLCEYDGAMLVIDKHAAHERVIFEDLKRTAERDGRVASQSLLLPITVLLSPDEVACAIEFKEEISVVGIEFEIGDSYANITAIPTSVGSMEAESLFVKMIDDIIDGKGDPAVTEKIRREQALYQVACKAAIKGGRVYDISVSEWIVKKVLELPDVIVCPHGRPIAYKLTKSELDRQFERIK